MAEVRREPRLPPIETPFLEADGKTITKAWYRYLQGERGFSDNVNSGATAAALAAANAAAIAAGAQAAAEAAAQQAVDVGADALSFSASISPSSVLKTRFGSGSATTATVTATPTGGTGPYTYAWALFSGDALTVTAPTSATTAFTGSVGIGEDKSAVYRCTITDSLAATAPATVGVAIAEIS